MEEGQNGLEIEQAMKLISLSDQLDSDRGQDAWNSGPKLTLRQIFCFAGTSTSDPAWLWWRTRSYNDLCVIQAGAWDANLLDREAAARWELARRDAGVSDATVAQWLGIELLEHMSKCRG